ncbi:MAG: hypothetical protein M1839_001559 [Geoglossum umbratile]|nr:MAG: hypothetical protein M1839_001559 [Geoglossum umbratile]
MASTQLPLNMKCAARLPVLSINAQMTTDNVRKDFTLPLLVHILASERLRQDVRCFKKQGPYKQEEVVTQFAISVNHHIEILLGPTLVTLTQGLQDYRSVRVSDQFLEGKIPTIGDLLDQAKDSFTALCVSWLRLTILLGHDYPVLPGSVVPTASPRQLLVNLLVNHPSILQKVVTGGDVVLGKFWLLLSPD